MRLRLLGPSVGGGFWFQPASEETGAGSVDIAVALACQRKTTRRKEIDTRRAKKGTFVLLTRQLISSPTATTAEAIESELTETECKLSSKTWRAASETQAKKGTGEAM